MKALSHATCVFDTRDRCPRLLQNTTNGPSNAAVGIKESATTFNPMTPTGLVVADMIEALSGKFDFEKVLYINQ